jgi:tetratricopeptide (TPR) repeat protein
LLATALMAQGRADEADKYAALSRHTSQENDPSGQAHWRLAMAQVLARRGEIEKAVQLAKEGIEIIERTDELINQPTLLSNQADVLELAGLRAEAEVALLKAVDAAARKGSLAEERRARERLAALQV